MNAKVMALVFIVSAVGLFSGLYIMFQTLTNNSSSSLPEENLELSNQHAWYNQSGWAEAAIVIVNVGERDTVLRKIAVRSIESKWSDVYYWRTDTGPISNELKQTSNELSGSSFNILVDGQKRNFQQATSELALTSGWTLVLYVRNPGNLTSGEQITDPAITIAVFSENKLYYKQATIDLTFTFMKTEEVKITSISWATGNTNSTLTTKNTGSSPLTVSLAKINGANAATYRYRIVGGTWSSSSPTISLTMNAGDSYDICLTKAGGAFTSGTKYEFAFQTAAGNTYPYTDTAP